MSAAAREPGRAATAAAERLCAMYEAHGEAVARICRALLRDRDEAEDAAQQTFLAAHYALLKGTVPRDAEAWLATIARNECRSRIRKVMSTPTTAPLVEDLDGAADGDPALQAELNAEIEQLLAALRELPERQRQALLLRDFQGMRYARVAEEMDATQSSVELLLWRARKLVQARGRLVADFGTLGILLREKLARLMPFGEQAATAAAGATGAATVAKAATVVTVAVTSVGTIGATKGDAPAAPVRESAAAPAALVAGDTGRGQGRGRGRSGESGQGRGRGRGGDEPRVDRSGRSKRADDSGGRGRGRGRGGDEKRAGSLAADHSSGSGSGDELRLEEVERELEDNSGSDSSGSGSDGFDFRSDSSGSGPDDD